MPTPIKPLPRDEARFARFSNEPPAKLPPGSTFPPPEELAKQTLKRIVQTQRNGIDGN